QTFFEDGHQGIDTNGDPQLGAHGIGTGSVKAFYTQMLFEPPEEQLDLPSLLIETGEVFDLVIAGVALNARMKVFAMDEIQELGQNELTGVRASRIAAASPFPPGSVSNPSHPTQCSFAS